MNAYPDIYASSDASHLTPDQIDDQLIGDLAAAPAAHLADCSFCAERVAAAASPIGCFQHVATAWSERRSATLPIPVPSQQRPIWQRHMAWATASLSLAFGIAFINASHQFSLQTATPQPALVQTTRPYATPQTIATQNTAPRAAALTETASIAPSPRAAQISADNHMLRVIDASFDPSADSPAALGLIPSTAQSNQPLPSIQD